MKIIVDLKKILRVGKAVSTDPQRYVINGVYITDFEKNGKFYRDYVGTDGRIMLIEREERKKIELEKGIILRPEKVKLTRQEQKFDGIDIELTELDGNYHHRYGKFEKIDGCYPTYWEILKSEVKETTVFNYLHHTYLKMTTEFFDTTKAVKFYSEKNVAEEPQFAFDYNYNGIKIAVIMPMHCIECEDIKKINENLKKWNL